MRTCTASSSSGFSPESAATSTAPSPRVTAESESAHSCTRPASSSRASTHACRRHPDRAVSWAASEQGGGAAPSSAHHVKPIAEDPAQRRVCRRTACQSRHRMGVARRHAMHCRRCQHGLAGGGHLGSATHHAICVCLGGGRHGRQALRVLQQQLHPLLDMLSALELRGYGLQAGRLCSGGARMRLLHYLRRVAGGDDNRTGDASVKLMTPGAAVEPHRLEAQHIPG